MYLIRKNYFQIYVLVKHKTKLCFCVLAYRYERPPIQISRQSNCVRVEPELSFSTKYIEIIPGEKVQRAHALDSFVLVSANE